MIWLAPILGYAVGSLPTAAWVAARAGVDLRSDGSRNPGANNARQLGGFRMGALVLIIEIGKGAGAVALGQWAAGDTGAALAGVAAIAGNIFNVWYGFAGGQGLGITAGVLLGAWPVWFGPVVAVIALVAYSTRSAHRAALAAIAAVVAGLGLFTVVDLPLSWGIDRFGLTLLATGIIALVTPKQLQRLRLNKPAL